MQEEEQEEETDESPRKSHREEKRLNPMAHHDEGSMEISLGANIPLSLIQGLERPLIYVH